jgi:beta-aspartyl-peptidase (threonine type)
MRLAGETLTSACDAVIKTMHAVHEGSGGVVAVDRHGSVAMPMNCEGMYRAWDNGRGDSGVAIYADE